MTVSLGTSENEKFSMFFCGRNTCSWGGIPGFVDQQIYNLRRGTWFHEKKAITPDTSCAQDTRHNAHNAHNAQYIQCTQCRMHTMHNWNTSWLWKWDLKMHTSQHTLLRKFAVNYMVRQSAIFVWHWQYTFWFFDKKKTKNVTCKLVTKSLVAQPQKHFIITQYVTHNRHAQRTRLHIHNTKNTQQYNTYSHNTQQRN